MGIEGWALSLVICSHKYIEKFISSVSFLPIAWAPGGFYSPVISEKRSVGYSSLSCATFMSLSYAVFRLNLFQQNWFWLCLRVRLTKEQINSWKTILVLYFLMFKETQVNTPEELLGVKNWYPNSGQKVRYAFLLEPHVLHWFMKLYRDRNCLSTKDYIMQTDLDMKEYRQHVFWKYCLRGNSLMKR